jgi:hypothetical protein
MEGLDALLVVIYYAYICLFTCVVLSPNIMLLYISNSLSEI